MQNSFSRFSSEELLTRTKTLISIERKTTLSIIECLEEIQRRRLYAELGFSSLWEFATKYLGLSEGAAQRRIQAMRLVRDEPTAKTALENGSLSLSNAAKIQSFIQKEEKQGRTVDTKAVIEKVDSMSQRECEKTLFELSPEPIADDSTRTVSKNDDRELKFVVSREIYDELQELKGLLAHQMPDASYAQLLKFLLKETLPRVKKKRGIEIQENEPTSIQVPKSLRNSNDITAAAIVPPPPLKPLPKLEKANPLPQGVRVYLPAHIDHHFFSKLLCGFGPVDKL